MKMYGLFKNTYDYYEWHNLICVSENKLSLINRHTEDYLREDFDCPLLAGKEQEKAKEEEAEHYQICEVELI